MREFYQSQTGDPSSTNKSTSHMPNHLQRFLGMCVTSTWTVDYKKIQTIVTLIVTRVTHVNPGSGYTFFF